MDAWFPLFLTHTHHTRCHHPPPVIFLVFSPFLKGRVTPSQAIMRPISLLSSSPTTRNSSMSLFESSPHLLISCTQMIPSSSWLRRLHFQLERMESLTPSIALLSYPLRKVFILLAPPTLHLLPEQSVVSTPVGPLDPSSLPLWSMCAMNGALSPFGLYPLSIQLPALAYTGGKGALTQGIH